MYIDYSFAKVMTILGLSIIKAEKKDMIALLYPHFIWLRPVRAVLMSYLVRGDSISTCCR